MAICDPCKQTADYDTAVIRGRIPYKRPGHCSDATCSCQHRPVGTIQFDTKKD